MDALSESPHSTRRTIIVSVGARSAESENNLLFLLVPGEQFIVSVGESVWPAG